MTICGQYIFLHQRLKLPITNSNLMYMCVKRRMFYDFNGQIILALKFLWIKTLKPDKGLTQAQRQQFIAKWLTEQSLKIAD